MFGCCGTAWEADASKSSGSVGVTLDEPDAKTSGPTSGDVKVTASASALDVAGITGESGLAGRVADAGVLVKVLGPCFGSVAL